MADDTPRMFTEGEHVAIADQLVATQTAQLSEKVTGLETQVASLQTKIDTLETENTGLVQRAEKAEADLAQFKADAEEAVAREAKRADRVAAIKEANPYLEITQEREDRLVAMSDEDFDVYVADMKEIASKVTAASGNGSQVPTQSAALHGGDAATPPDGGSEGGSVSSMFGARRGLIEKGA